LKHTASLLLHCIFPLKSSAVHCSTTVVLLIVYWDFILIIYCICTAILLQFCKGMIIEHIIHKVVHWFDAIRGACISFTDILVSKLLYKHVHHSFNFYLIICTILTGRQIMTRIRDKRNTVQIDMPPIICKPVFWGFFFLQRLFNTEMLMLIKAWQQLTHHTDLNIMIKAMKSMLIMLYDII
jgi:hypothetical protein